MHTDTHVTGQKPGANQEAQRKACAEKIREKYWGELGRNHSCCVGLRGLGLSYRTSLVGWLLCCPTPWQQTLTVSVASAAWRFLLVLQSLQGCGSRATFFPHFVRRLHVESSGSLCTRGSRIEVQAFTELRGKFATRLAALDKINFP